MTDTNAFIISRAIHTPLVREPRPAQFALSGSALEWQGYKAACVRLQQGPNGPESKRSKKGPNAEALDPWTD